MFLLWILSRVPRETVAEEKEDDVNDEQHRRRPEEYQREEEEEERVALPSSELALLSLSPSFSDSLDDVSSETKGMI